MYDEQYMKISGEAYGSTVTVQISQDSNLYDFVQACRTVALGLTFHEQSWREVIMDIADEYRDEDIRKEKQRRQNDAGDNYIFHHSV